METSIADKIRVKQAQIQAEMDPIKREELQAQMRKLQLRKQLEDIQSRID